MGPRSCIMCRRMPDNGGYPPAISVLISCTAVACVPNDPDCGMHRRSATRPSLPRFGGCHLSVVLISHTTGNSMNRWARSGRHVDNHRTMVNALNTPPGTGTTRNETNGDRRNGAFGSYHPGGGNFLLGDGSVRFISETIDFATYRALSTRNGAETLGEF